MNTATTSIREELKDGFEQLCNSLSVSFEEQAPSRQGCAEYRLKVPDLDTFFELGLLSRQLACPHRTADRPLPSDEAENYKGL